MAHEPSGLRGAEKTLEGKGRHVLVPEVLKVMGSAAVEGSLIRLVEATGELRDGEVVVGVFNGSGASAFVGCGDEAFFVVVL